MAIKQEKQGMWEKSNETKTIVLVEDDVSNAEMIELFIQTETPHRVFILQHGHELLRRLEEVKACRPALFLLDYHLPAMSALEIYDQLHTIEEFKHVPTMVITASLVNDFESEFTKRNIPLLYKPFELDELLGSIKRLMV